MQPTSGTWIQDSGSSLAAILAALFAAGGYVAKLLVDMGRGLLQVRRERSASLVELDALLRASSTVFLVQNDLVRRLNASLRNRIIDEALPEGLTVTFDDVFVAAFSKLTPEEKELHGVVRAMTQHALKQINDGLAQWLSADDYFKARRGATGLAGELANQLAALDAHLQLWRAKCVYWMADPRHAIVYLNDEAAHGTPFPSGIDKTVAKLLQTS